MTSHLDDGPDIPPPPYSETDIYSNPGSHGHSPILSQSQILPAHHRTPSHNNSNSVPVMDDASSAASTGEVIYTPALSPSSPQSQSYNSGNNNLLSPRHAEQQNTVSVSSEHLTSASAEAYFDSRPVPASCGGIEQQLMHTIVIQADSSPDDFPYRRDWASLDVKEEDWQTFLNYLLPNHAAQRNEVVIERKLRAEGVDTDDTKSARSTETEKSATNAAAEERTPVEAQLDKIRAPDLQQRQDIEQTVWEWNDGFFGPRGMVVKVDENATLGENYRMPGAWDQSSNNSSPNLADSGTSPVDRRANNSGPSGPPRQPDNTGRWRRFNPMNRFDNSSNGLNIPGVSIDSNSVSIGRNFVANPNGLRIGGVVMDNNGVRIGGRDLFGGGRTASPPAGQPAAPFVPIPPQPPMPPLPQGYSHGQQAHYARMPPPPPGFPTPPPPPEFDTHDRDEYPDEKAQGRTRGPDRHHDHHDHHHGHGHGHGGGRGRGRAPGRYSNGASHRHRSRSSSSSPSSSSSSSSSSAGSDSDTLSVGSLPDYDDLKDSQLPVAKTYLEEWLSRPENFVTRETVKEAREEIKAARRTAPRDISDPVERNAMRQQVRGMMGQWRVLKREQRAARRQRKRDKRARRRAEKKERRQARRERKRSRREAKREGRRGGRRDHDHDHDAGHHSHSGQGPFGHHGGPGPFGIGHHGGFGPFGGRGGPFSLGGRDFPGAGFGPGARQRRGGGGPQGPFQTGPLPCGGLGGPFPNGGPGHWGEGFSRNMADWSRRMGEWSRDFSAGQHPSGPGANQPRFPGSWPAEAEDNQQGKEAAGQDGQQEAGIQPKDDDGEPHAASAAMYKSLEAKREALQGKRDALANFSDDSPGEDSQGHKQGAPSLVGMLAEIEELEKAVAKLGLEADEQFAKELAALED